MSYKIPLFRLNYDEEEEKAILDTLRSKWISMGPKNEELEKTFSSMLKIKYSVALTNCTTSLHLALQIAGVKEYDEVICPSLTFVATVNAIRYLKAVPVFCDITSYDNLNIDPEKIKKLISPKTKVILVMHYGGFPCEMDKIMEIAEDNQIKVIEDACHGPLSEYKGKKLGTIGDIGCFSFFSNKNISTGEGGMLVTDKEEYYNKAKLLRSHGMTTLSYERSKGHSSSYDVVELGYNYRMDDIRASIGIVQLKKLKDDLKKRAEIRTIYLNKLSANDKFFIPFKEVKSFSSNYIFPVVLKNSKINKRNSVRESLSNAGIQTSVHYPAVHQFSIYKDFKKNLPITEYVTENEISLPMFSDLKQEDIQFVADTLVSSL